MKTLLLITLVIILASCSCGKDEVTLSRLDIYKLVRKVDSNMKVVIPKTINDGVKCSDYTPGCLHGHRVLIDNIEVTFVEFSDMAHAKRAAYKFRGYYLFNWMLDDFRGEPSLERIAVKKLGAIAQTEYIKPYPEEIEKDKTIKAKKPSAN
jgi:hypothetical protein